MTTFEDSPRPAKKRKTASPIPDGEIPSEDALEALRQILSTVSSTTLSAFKTSLLGPISRQHLTLDDAFTEDEYQKVQSLLSQTVLAGEGNSMLVIGSRGSGKSSLVESVISDLSTDHRDDFHVVRLNGFIHTDDKLALREIWRQLGREMEVEDESSGRTNYADTLTSLLALLSHTPETTDPDTLESEPEVTAKAVIFILSEFDLFASHPRQTLLYNLFDIAQSRNAPIAVLGLTTKISVAETLEKRVKSRFGQRFIHLSLPGRSFSTFTSMCKTALQPPKTDISASLQLSASKHAELNALGVAWCRYFDHLFTTSALLTHLRAIHSTTASLPAFLTSALVPLSLLSPTCIPTFEAFATHSLAPPDSKLHLLSSLSDLALSLIIAAARLDIVLDTDLCNFEMVYEEYVTLASRLKQQTSASGQVVVGGQGGRVWGRGVAKGEWERLVRLELMLPASGGGEAGAAGTGRKGERGRMWRVDVGLEEIAGSVPGLGAVMGRWCREI